MIQTSERKLEFVSLKAGSYSAASACIHSYPQNRSRSGAPRVSAKPLETLSENPLETRGHYTSGHDSVAEWTYDAPLQTSATRPSRSFVRTINLYLVLLQYPVVLPVNLNRTLQLWVVPLLHKSIQRVMHL